MGRPRPMELAEAARIVGLPPAEVIELARLDILPGFTIGRLWHFDPLDVRRFAERSRPLGSS